VKVLLHTCCAVCLHGPLEALTSAGHEVSVLFFNPNVHPLLEFRRRLKALRVFAESSPIDIVAVEDYGLTEFLERVDWRSGAPKRCLDCYRLRLGRTAAEAKARGFDAFSTTLLVSPMQDRSAVLRAGREAHEGAGARFLEADWRDLYRGSHEYAKSRSLYHQQYCGCIFSEAERFAPTRKHLYAGNPRRQMRENAT